MEAKYIIDALKAMEAARKALWHYPDADNFNHNCRVADELASAEANLRVRSGIDNFDVRVEKVAA